MLLVLLSIWFLSCENTSGTEVKIFRLEVEKISTRISMTQAMRVRLVYCFTSITEAYVEFYKELPLTVVQKWQNFKHETHF